MMSEFELELELLGPFDFVFGLIQVRTFAYKEARDLTSGRDAPLGVGAISSFVPTPSFPTFNLKGVYFLEPAPESRRAFALLSRSAAEYRLGIGRLQGDSEHNEFFVLRFMRDQKAILALFDPREEPSRATVPVDAIPSAPLPEPLEEFDEGDRDLVMASSLIDILESDWPGCKRKLESADAYWVTPPAGSRNFSTSRVVHHGLSGGFLFVAGALHFLFYLLLLLSFLGVCWQLAGYAWSDPLNALWAVPVALIFLLVLYSIVEFLFNLVVVLPLVLLSRLLQRRRGN